MNLADARILLTGASGGIGSAILEDLVRHGARVLITGRDRDVLRHLARTVDRDRGSVEVHPADIAQPDDRRRLVQLAASWQGGVNVLINNAGVAAFGMLDNMRAEDIETVMAVNVLAPMHLCSSLLPHLKQQRDAHIVNIGSVFGAIGYPGHAAYSASKFALRGFSEALRRELVQSAVRVHYIAPRATRTKFNCSSVDALNAQFSVAVDAPEHVARSVRRMLETDQLESVIGWPEKLFVRINAVLPRLVDRSLAKQSLAIRQHLAASPPTATPVTFLSRKAS